MKRLGQSMVRFLLLVILVLASVPSLATEKVCVIDSLKKVVPIGKCGMPCCQPKEIAPPKTDCCGNKVSEPVFRSDAQTPCLMDGMQCHCETRLTRATNYVPATTVGLIGEVIDQPAILTPQLSIPVAPAKLESSPTIFYFDRGPPRKPIRRSDQSRAPPVPF